MTHDDGLPEAARYLVVLATAPAIWILHFLACYVTTAVWCARAGAEAPLGGVRPAIGAYTAIAVAGIAAVGWDGLRRHRHGGEPTPHDADTAADRHRFLGFATALLAGLSLVATLYVAAAALAFDTCG